MRQVLLTALSVLLVLGFAACEKEKGLKIKRISPSSGPVSGASPVTIHGSGFDSGGARDVTVFFGNRKATVMGYKGDSQLVVQPPGGKLGEVVDIMIQFGDSRYFTRKKAYTYVDTKAGFGLEEALGNKAKKKKPSGKKPPASDKK